MASPPPSRSAGQDEAHDTPGPPPMEQQLGSGPDLETMDASLETGSVDPNPGNMPHSNPPSEPFGGLQAEPIKLDTASLGLGPGQEPDAQPQTTISRRAQQPQTPLTPVVGPGFAPGWRKRVINVKNKLGTTKQNQAPTSQRPGASGLDSSKPSHVGQGKAAKAAKAEAATHDTNEPELPALVDLSNLAPSLVPTAEIIAIPDIGQSLSTAWAYIPEKNFAKRPAAPANTAVGPAPPGRQVPSKGAAAFRAGLKALEEIGRVKGTVKDWTDSTGPAVATRGWKGERGEQAPGTLANEPTATPVDKAKGKADGNDMGILEDVERGRRPPTPQQPRLSTAEETAREKRADADDRTSRHSNRPSSTRGSKPPSEKDKALKAGNWLTDRTMFASDVDRARVWGFAYKPPEQPQSADNPSKKPDYDKYLNETAEALRSCLKMKPESRCSLVFVATGFGCLIVQRLLAQIAQVPDHMPNESIEVLLLSAAVLFLDPPSPIPKEKAKTERTKTAPLLAFPAPTSSTRANRLRGILESKTIDGWDIWERFHAVVIKRDLPVVWFYTQAQIPNRNGGSLRAAGVDFVMLSDPAPVKHTTNSRVSSRFRGPGDPNYRSFVDQVRRFLFLRASAVRDCEELLTQCIDQGYNLGVKDHKKRCALHLAVQSTNDAALMRLVSARPSLVMEQDKDGATPLHVAIIDAGLYGSFRRASYRMMIEKLLLAMADNKYDDETRDSENKSAWHYALEANHRWILDLKNNQYLFNGARAAQPEAIDDSEPVFTPAEISACVTLNATLAQFYISNDDTSDYLEFQRPDVFSVVYDHEDYGIGKLFERNLRHDDDKRATCRWVHLPANNEKWVHDLFAKQLRRIDKSTSTRRHIGSTPFDRHIIPGAVRYKQTYEPLPGEVFPSPSPRYPFPSPSSFSNKSGDGLGIPKKAVTALFIPVFGFEKHRNRQKLSTTMKFGNLSSNDETCLLVRAYFDKDKLPLHCRRTLDQFTYHMLDDTERRDNSQVMSRWGRRESAKKYKLGQGPRPGRGGRPVLMIDQLWLWVLEDEQTIITSLPNTWEPAEDYNLIRHLMHKELRDNDDRPLIKGCTDLANAIIRCSVDFLHRQGPLKVSLYECFQSSITLVAERQALQFEEFESLVHRLTQGGIDVQERANLTNNLFQLTKETRLLAEIIDIQDELKTIHEVFLRQRDALKKFAKLMSNQGQNRDRADDESDIVENNTPESSQFGYPLFEDHDHESPDHHGERRPLHSAMYREGGRPKLERNVRFADERTQYQRPKARNQAEENLHLVETNILTIKEMTMYAEKVRVEINGLLSHRQKQANAWEARFAREGSEHTQRQSNITLVFTAVTVLFLPLSFMSSVFAIQIDAFPHNPETGEVNWPLPNVMGLLFGLSLGTISLVALLGFYINRISRLYTKYFGDTTNQPITATGPNHHGHSDSDSDSDFHSTTTARRSRHSSHDFLSEHWSHHSHATNRPRYARLFRRWTFHEHIPLVRNLWRLRFYRRFYRRYRPAAPAPRPPSPAESYVGSDDDGGGELDADGFDGDRDRHRHRRRAPSVLSSSSWGVNEWEEVEDYPVHRAHVLMERFVEEQSVRLLRRVAPEWLMRNVRHLRVKEKVEEGEWEGKEEYYGEGEEEAAEENSIRPSMQRSSVVTRSEASWDVPPEGPLRRRRTEQREGRLRGASVLVAGLFPWRWGGPADGQPVTVSSESGGGSVDVALDPDEDDSVPGGDGGEGGRGPGKKGIGLGIPMPLQIPLPSFGRKKVREEDVESSNRATAWARDSASAPSRGPRLP